MLLIHASQDDFKGNLIDVKTKGGDIKVSFDKSVEGDFSNVFLIGPANKFLMDTSKFDFTFDHLKIIPEFKENDGLWLWIFTPTKFLLT